MSTEVVYLVHFSFNRYSILSTKIANSAETEKKATEQILEKIQLEPEKYRMGNTKARFIYWLQTPVSNGIVIFH